MYSIIKNLYIIECLNLKVEAKVEVVLGNPPLFVDYPSTHIIIL